MGAQGQGGPPMVPGATKTPVDPNLIQRLTAGARGAIDAFRDAFRAGMTSGSRLEAELQQRVAEAGAQAQRPVPDSQVVRPPGQPGDISNGWFGPGNPMQPVAPYRLAAARAFDFPAATNLTTQRRKGEAVSFETLRALASYDLIRLAIETRKDQVAKVKWSILPKRPPGQKHATKADDTCRQVEEFLQRPDGILNWSEWVRSVTEDSLVLDGVALYRRRRRDGAPYALEQIDAATINLLIDETGRRPLAPNPAYQQILKGLPATEYTVDEMTYSIRNPRAHKLFGYSPVEQIVTYVNIGLRRMTQQLMHYTSGNLPEALASVPEGWSTEQIAEFQSYWDQIMESPENRRRMRWVPPGTNYYPVHGEGGAGLMDPFDEWLARVVCYAFSLPSLPFVKMQNRSTAETAYQTALEEGLEPMLEWLKRLIDGEIAKFLGHANYELVWDNVRKNDPAEQQAMDLQDQQRGILSVDEIRTGRGLEPVGLKEPIIIGIGPMGFMSVKAVQKAIEQGLDMPQPAPAVDAMGNPTGADPLSGAPPALMNELGIGGGSGSPPGAAGRPVAGLGDGEEDDGDGSGENVSAPPAAPVSLAALLRRAPGHPAVRQELRGFERRLLSRRR